MESFIGRGDGTGVELRGLRKIKNTRVFNPFHADQ